MLRYVSEGDLSRVVATLERRAARLLTYLQHADLIVVFGKLLPRLAGIPPAVRKAQSAEHCQHVVGLRATDVFVAFV